MSAVSLGCCFAAMFLSLWAHVQGGASEARKAERCQRSAARTLSMYCKWPILEWAIIPVA
eukprot:3067628-Prorocentrum_lima.AAC.1